MASESNLRSVVATADNGNLPEAGKTPTFLPILQALTEFGINAEQSIITDNIGTEVIDEAQKGALVRDISQEASSKLKRLLEYLRRPLEEHVAERVTDIETGISVETLTSKTDKGKFVVVQISTKPPVKERENPSFVGINRLEVDEFGMSIFNFSTANPGSPEQHTSFRVTVFEDARRFSFEREVFEDPQMTLNISYH
jgi:hypothetical protein